MHITLTKDYSVKADTTLLGYQGETNSRKITFSGLVVDGCDLYKLQILYSDGKVYELPIQDEVVTITGSILREIGYVSCQLLGYSVSGSDYTIVFKSNIFELEIKEAIDGEVAPIPPYEESVGALEKVLAGVEAAKGYSESAETSANSAETARQQAVTQANAAKISADLAAAAAQQTTADKTATAGYAKTAKTNADSTTADRQAVQTLAEQVTADKATVADHATQVAEDRTAAETAAQTAQAVADSLPEDYTTAVGKIAENTAEIGRVKLTDKELQRRVNALYDLGNGITHQFETDTDTAYQKTVPTGAKLMSVKNVGGRSIVFNQIFETYSGANNGVTVTTETDGTITLNGTTTSSFINFKDITPEQDKIGKYMFKLLILNNPDNIKMGFGFLNRSELTPIITSGSSATIYNQTQSEISRGKYTGIGGFAVGTVFNNVKIKVQIFDLTLMFGTGNEPTTVEEFEKMFPADYYPYNAGEIISAGTESIIEQGANLYYGTDMLKVGSDDYEYLELYWAKSIKLKPKTTYTIEFKSQKTSDVILLLHVKKKVNDNGFVDFRKTGDTATYTTSEDGYLYVGVTGVHSTSADVVKRLSECEIMISEGNTPTAYAPYHSNVYQIPEAIRNLPGYGVEGNVVDYEAKTYTQNNTVDGTEVKELDTPIVTDISSLIPDDFLRNIEVEALGSVTFKNSNGDSYRIPVPSEEEYIVKLSEVGGTT